MLQTLVMDPAMYTLDPASLPTLRVDLWAFDDSGIPRGFILDFPIRKKVPLRSLRRPNEAATDLDQDCTRS